MNARKILGASFAALAAISLGMSAVRADDSDSRTAGFGWGWWGGHDDPRACARSDAQLERNVRTAINYYTLAFNSGLPRLAVDKYIGVDKNGNKTYTQHNPFAADGPEAFIAFVEFYKGLFPDLNVRIVRTIAQCDLVMTHAHITTSATDLGNAAMDIFRFDRTGRIVEHWDAVQPVEENPANDNTQF
jgi:predicted SnoaL-like aldol condensation-catalyzing enzyme